MIHASRGPTAVTIIFIIFTGFLMILLLLALLNILKTKTSKACLILAVLMWVAYSCFFWAALTLQSQSNDAQQGIQCAYKSLANNILWGNKGSAEEFIGIKNMSDVYSNLSADLDKIQAKTATATALSNADFQGTADTL